MLRVNKIYVLSFFFLLIVFSGCTSTTNENIDKKNEAINQKTQLSSKSKLSKKTQIKKENISTKIFFNVDKTTLEKAIKKTMIEEEFYITSVNKKRGIINAMGNKNTLDINFVAYFKENSDKSFSVTLNIHALGSGPYSVTHGNLQEKLLYERLFENLNNFIYIENKIIDNTVVQKIIQEEILDSKLVIEKSSPIEEEYPFYSIQFISTKDENIADNYFKVISRRFIEARLEKLKYFYVIRLGKFKEYSKAMNLYVSLPMEFKDSIVVDVKSKQ